MLKSIQPINRTVEKTNIWLHELKEKGHFHDEAQAYSALRAVLHALRDRLTVEEACDLGAQLPMLVRGVYFEGFRPAASPRKERTEQQFVEHVRDVLRNANDTIDATHASQTVFAFLEGKITGGEMADVAAELPKKIRRFLESSEPLKPRN